MTNRMGSIFMHRMESRVMYNIWNGDSGYIGFEEGAACMSYGSPWFYIDWLASDWWENGYDYYPWGGNIWFNGRAKGFLRFNQVWKDDKRLRN